MTCRHSDLSPLEARRLLGKHLYEILERSDPSDVFVPFDELSPTDRHLYIDAIAYLFDYDDLIRKALEDTRLLLHSYEGPPKLANRRQLYT